MYKQADDGVDLDQHHLHHLLPELPHGSVRVSDSQSLCIDPINRFENQSYAHRHPIHRTLQPRTLQPTNHPTHPTTHHTTGLAVTGRDLFALALSVPAFHLASLLLMFLLARAVTPTNRGEQVRY